MYLPLLLSQQTLHPLIHSACTRFSFQIVDRTFEYFLCSICSRLRVDTGCLEQRRRLIERRLWRVREWWIEPWGMEVAKRDYQYEEQ